LGEMRYHPLRGVTHRISPKFPDVLPKVANRRLYHYYLLNNFRRFSYYNMGIPARIGLVIDRELTYSRSQLDKVGKRLIKKKGE
jgi:hypothetical protein